MKKYDAIIIGTGGGNKIGTVLQKLGQKVALIEKSKAGGTCLNRGCIPSKMMIYPAKLNRTLADYQKIDVQVSDVKINFPELMERINSDTDSSASSIARSHEKNTELDYYQGHARFIADKVIQVNGEELTAETIIIATGSRPKIPDIPGLAHTPFMTSNEALRARKVPESMLVIGGGYIATELGGAYANLGSKVSFLLRSDFLRHVDSDIRDIFIEEFSSRVDTIKYQKITSVSYADGKFTVIVDGKEYQADELLVCAGVVPNADQLGLDKTAIKTNEAGYLQVNDHLETNVSGVYAMGDVIGKYLFRHSVNFESEYWLDANHVSKHGDAINYPPMPAAVFTDPEIASVGASEEELKKSVINYFVAKAPYRSAMTKARGKSLGLVKLLFADKSSATPGKLLGAHIIGDEASTLIQELVLAASNDLTITDLYRQIYIHPALPEIIRNAVRDGLKQYDEKYQLLV